MGELVDLGRPVAERLLARKQKVAISESSSGGLISAALLSIGGASAYFMGAAVVYTLEARRAFLPDDVLQKGIRSSSEPYALANARAIRARLGVDWAVCESGAAGPTGNRYGDKPGHTALAVVGPGGVERSLTIETESDDREANMWAFTRAALALLAECLEGTAA
jgi:PncC family amidohydrolase